MSGLKNGKIRKLINSSLPMERTSLIVSIEERQKFIFLSDKGVTLISDKMPITGKTGFPDFYFLVVCAFIFLYN